MSIGDDTGRGRATTGPMKLLLAELLDGALLVHDPEHRYSKNTDWKTVKDGEFIRAVRSVTIIAARSRGWLAGTGGTGQTLSEVGRRYAQELASPASMARTSSLLSYSEILDALAASWPANLRSTAALDENDEDES